MFIRFLLLALPLMSPLVGHASNLGVRFVEGDLEETKAQAREEGKMLFVHFTADWCLPCRWMEAETYQDEALANYLNDKFIALRLDIDKPSNYKAKSDYQVVLLPSMLVFDKRGQLQARYEESLPAEGLLKRLQGIAPGDIMLAEPVPAKVPEKDPETVVENPFPTIRESSPDPFVKPEPVKVTPPPPSTPTTIVSPEAPAKANFAIQVGVYSHFENAQSEANRLEKLLDQKVQVVQGELGNKSIYRVLAGQFEDPEEANEYRRQLSSRFKMEGVVKNLQLLQANGAG